MANNITFFDLILAEALHAGLVRIQVEKPPDNFFQLPKDVLTWKKIQAACKRENMVICLEITNDASDECLEIQDMYIDLARDFEDILFLRAVIEPNSTFDELRSDVGGVEYMPTILVLFYDVKITLCTKIQGHEEIVQSFEMGNIRRKVIEYSQCRLRLKKMEQLIHHLISPLSRQEEMLRKHYEESFQSKLKEQEEKIVEEERRKLEEQRKKEDEQRLLQEKMKKQEDVKRSQEEFKNNRPKYVQELLALDLEKATVTQLKTFTQKLNISSHECAEKKDLKEKLIEGVPELRMKMEKKNKSSNCSINFWLLALTMALMIAATGIYIRHHVMANPDHPRHIFQESKRELIKELQDIGNWESLCNNLGVSEAHMKIFQYEAIEVVIKKERCLSAYVDSGYATWDDVVEVVCSSPFENRELGKKIAIKYGVPLEVC